MKFKETPAFEDLQKIVGHDIAGIYLARLKEYGVPEDKLLKVAEEICYDVASALTKLQDFEVPTVALPAPAPVQEARPAPAQEAKPEVVVSPEKELTEEPDPDANPVNTRSTEEKTDDLGQPDISLESTDEFELPDLDSDELAFLEEKTDRFERTDKQNQPAPRAVKGVLSQAEILKILNSAQTASH